MPMSDVYTTVYAPPDLAECRSCSITARIGTYPHYITYRVPNDASPGNYCTDCAFFCDDCEEYYTGPYGCEGDCHESSGCTCVSCQPSYSRLINDYSFKPQPVFHGTGPAFLGLELEVSAPWRSSETCAETAVGHLGDLGYLKEDSSIGNGFEIVTHPMTYDWALERFPWAMLHELSTLGVEASDDCGMHVHVSREAFTGPAHVFRWMKLIYRNESKVEHVARRTSSQWASFGKGDRKHQKDIAKAGGALYHMPRYVAINVNNDATFEVRVFASSLKEQEVKAALGLVAASVEYTRGLTAHDVIKNDAWGWDAFTAWLPEKYAPLRAETEKTVCAY
jgi:hypothetical protein